MEIPRRRFLGLAMVAGARPQAVARSLQRLAGQVPDRRFDPWIEVDASALAHNVSEVTRLTQGRPILAVIKNNAYGLGLDLTARLLEPLSAIAGFAVVKPEAAMRLRRAGVRKPVLLMGMASDEESRELVELDVQLSLYTPDAARRLDTLADAGAGSPRAHFYLDTGMGRMGMSFRQALPWMEELGKRTDVRIQGTFTALTEDQEFDPVQLERLSSLVAQAHSRRTPLGAVHAAASNAVFHLPGAHLDMVRPGIALFGGYPSRPEEERELARLRPAVRLRCRVVRVDRLEKGDGVSYGRRYIADKPTWIATLPVGHSDGYPRSAVNGAEVLIWGRRYPVIGAVSASHTIVELGDSQSVAVGDVATLLGPDDPSIFPNALADAAGVSVYDVLMHLNPELPRIQV